MRTARTVMMTGDRRVDKPRLRRVFQTNDKRQTSLGPGSRAGPFGSILGRVLSCMDRVLSACLACSGLECSRNAHHLPAAGILIRR